MISRISNILSTWLTRYRSLDRNGRTYVWLIVGACLVCLLLVVGLREMDHFWNGRTATRIAKGEQLKPGDFCKIGMFWAGVGNVVLWLLLAITARKWWSWAGGRDELPLTELKEEVLEESQLGGGEMQRVGWLVLIGILVMAACIRYPQLERSVMFDEQDNLRWNIHGYYDMEHKSGKPKFIDAGWEGAFIANRNGNNPILLSVTSRASIAIWRKMTGVPTDVFSAKAMRIPVFVAGLGSIVGIYWFLTLLGLWRAGLFAAFFAAVHPFHIEYSIEARAYGFVILGASLAVSMALLALRTNRWRYWIGLGGCFLVMLYAYLGSIYFVATFGLMIVAYLGFQAFRNHKKESRAALVRFAIVGVITLSIYLQLTLPALLQFMEAWAENRQRTNPLGMEWIFAVITEYSTGALLVSAWREATELAGGDMSLAKYVTSVLFKTDPIYVVLVFLLIPICLIAGAIRLLRMEAEVKLLVSAVILAPVLMFLHHKFGTHSVLLFWYLIFALPAVIVFVAVGLDLLGKGVFSGIKSIPEVGQIAVSLVIVGAFFWVYIVQTQPGKKGRNSQNCGDNRPYVSYTRGHFKWIVYKNGYSLRVLGTNKVPESFGGSD